MKSTFVKPEVDPPEVMAFMKESGIQHHRILIPNIRKALGIVPIMNTARIMRILSDVASHPVLIHCNKGKVWLSLSLRIKLLATISRVN